MLYINLALPLRQVRWFDYRLFLAFSLFSGILKSIQSAKCNNQITAPELRVIDETGENLGVLSFKDALKMAVDKGLDLIEIVPTAKPPVAKIMAFDKYRYQQEKLYKKQRAAQKTAGLKHVRISIRTQKNDLDVAARKVNEFLEEGHKVEIQVHLRGREKSMRDLAKQKFRDFLKYITVEHRVTVEPSFGMRGMAAQIAKKAA